MVPLVAVAVEKFFQTLLFEKAQEKSIKSTKPNARCCTHCYNLGYNKTAHAATVSQWHKMANHVNQLDRLYHAIYYKSTH